MCLGTSPFRKSLVEFQRHIMDKHLTQKLSAIFQEELFGPNSYVCPVFMCKTVELSKVTLNKHFRTSHLEMLPSANATDNIVFQAIQDLRQKQCPDCGRMFPKPFVSR